MTDFKNRFLDEYGFQDPLKDLKINRRRYNMTDNNKIEDSEYEEVKSDIFKFEKPGDRIIGELIAKEKSFSYDNMVYKIKQSDDAVKVVFGTTVLDSVMQEIQLGDNVMIVFDSIKENKKKGQNDIKVFKVFKRRA